MRMRWLPGLMCFLVFSSGYGGEIGVPWQEVRQLLEKQTREATTTELREEYGLDEPEPQRTVLTSAHCALTVGLRSAAGTVTVSGNVVSGKPVPVPLLPGRTILSRVGEVTGGALCRSDADGGAICFLPAGHDVFGADLEIVLPLAEDDQSRYISLDMPRALVTTLGVGLPSGWRLLDPPGAPGADGLFYLPGSGSASELRIRFVSGLVDAEPRAVEVDVMSHFDLSGNRFLLESTFVPKQPLRGSITIQGPVGGQVLTTSLRRSWLASTGGSQLGLNLPEPVGAPFTVQFLLPENGKTAEFTVRLPTLEGNSGCEGLFVITDPPGADVTTEGDGLTTGVPGASLGERLRDGMAGRDVYARIPPGNPLTIRIRHLQTVSSPSIVLEDLALFTSFGESGGRLSVLRMSVPAAAGRFLPVQRVEGSDIWALTVDGQPARVYADEEHWIVPLTMGRESTVELAFLSRGEKLGLRGRLAARMPATGLSAKTVRVVLGLPERVRLLSVEGPVNPDTVGATSFPDGFAGTPYSFVRRFYKGEGFDVSLYYKEPAKEPAAREP